MTTRLFNRPKAAAQYINLGWMTGEEYVDFVLLAADEEGVSYTRDSISLVSLSAPKAGVLVDAAVSTYIRHFSSEEDADRLLEVLAARREVYTTPDDVMSLAEREAAAAELSEEAARLPNVPTTRVEIAAALGLNSDKAKAEGVVKRATTDHFIERFRETQSPEDAPPLPLLEFRIGANGSVECANPWVYADPFSDAPALYISEIAREIETKIGNAYRLAAAYEAIGAPLKPAVANHVQRLSLALRSAEELAEDDVDAEFYEDAFADLDDEDEEEGLL